MSTEAKQPGVAPDASAGSARPQSAAKMAKPDGSISFYLFDIDDNLFFLSTKLYLWNAETREEFIVSSAEFARVQNELGKAGRWYAWALREETFRDFRDRPDLAAEEQMFVHDLLAAVAGTGPWQGPSWPLLIHAAKEQRPIAIISARGHEPATIEAGIRALVGRGFLPAVPPILGIYTVTNKGVRAQLGALDPAMTVPSLKKLAIKDAVETALMRYGTAPPHRFGISDDDPNNVVLAISAMRDCKKKYPDKRFFVINSNQDEFVKLEIFQMLHPVTAAAAGIPLLSPEQPAPEGVPVSSLSTTAGGNVSVYVSDMTRAISFYTEKLGLRLRTRIQDEWAELDAGQGLTIGLHPAHPPLTAAPGTAGAINIELAVTKPLDEVVQVLKLRGVVFAGPIQSYENVRLAQLSDPDGNVLLLAQVLHSGSTDVGSSNRADRPRSG